MIMATQDEPNHSSYRLNDPRRAEWVEARNLYAGIINAHLAWSPDDTANSAIVKFRNDLDSEDLGTTLRVVGIAGADLKIRKRILRDTVPACKLDLFDWFHDYHIEYCSQKMRRAAHAKLSLYHPTNADPVPMLEYVKHKTEHAQRVQPQLPKQSETKWVAAYLLRTCFLLRLRDQVSDAQWLESYVQEHFPKAWEVRDQWFYFTARDPKLQYLLKGKLNASWIPQTFVPSRGKKHRRSRTAQRMTDEDIRWSHFDGE
jgi:hypothetical protein